MVITFPLPGPEAVDAAIVDEWWKNARLYTPGGAERLINHIESVGIAAVDYAQFVNDTTKKLFVYGSVDGDDIVYLGIAADDPTVFDP